MTRRYEIGFALAIVALTGACAADTGQARGAVGDEGAQRSAVASDAAPDEVELCDIGFGESHRADVERVLGKPDTTRETLDRIVMLYEFEGGTVTYALHLDADVFREFSVYGAPIPQCWARAKRMSLERASDAGAAPDAQPQ